MASMVNILSLCLPIFICAAIGAYVLATDNGALKNKLFFGYNMLVSVLAFCQYQYRVSATEAEAAEWYLIQFMWPFMLALPMHFIQEICTPVSKAFKISAVLIYVPAAIISVLFWIPGLFYTSHVMGWAGWEPTLDHGFFSVFVISWSLISALYSLFLLSKSISLSTSYVQRMQLVSIRWAYIIGYIIGIGTGIFIPYIFGLQVTFDKFAIMASNVVIAYAMARYGLFQFTPRSIAESVVQSMPAYLFVTDDKGKVQMINNAASDVMKKPRHHILGKNLSSIFSSSMAGDSSGGAVTEDYILADAARPVPVKKVSSHIYGPGGVFIGTVYIAIDRSELREVERQLVEAIEMARESDRLKSVFLANISHEIRTPMNAILGFSQMLERTGGVNGASAKYIELISKNTVSLLKIIDDLLEISKLESSKTKINRTTIIVQELLDKCSSYCADISGGYGRQELVFTSRIIGDSRQQILADSDILQKVMSKLAENAVKFTEKGAIELGYYSIDDTIGVFYVKDTGVGIPQRNSTTIFDYFRQAEESSTRKFGGTGISLTIAKRYVELIGGRIWAESEEQSGSIFYVSIPIWTK
jgi:signal transduction histidine kinase